VPGRSFMKQGTGRGMLMGQRTRLYQHVGSPLIQGQSKSRRPVWQECVQCVAATVVATVAYCLVNLAVVSDASSPELLAQVLPAALLGAEVGIVVGTIMVLIARGMGARRPWLIATVVSVLVAVVLWTVLPAVR